jgi:hypothetical protein
MKEVQDILRINHIYEKRAIDLFARFRTPVATIAENTSTGKL